MYHFTALVTCLAILFYFFTAHPGVEGARRIRRQGAGDLGPSRFRAGVPRADEHAGMDADLPALAVAVRDLYQRPHRGRAIGLVWIAGRILYMIGYLQTAAKRGPGFLIQAAAAIMLWLGALGAIVWRAVHG